MLVGQSAIIIFMKYPKTWSASRGFTLIELLVVVAIIVILSGLILTSMGGARAKSRDAQRVSDLHQLQLALTLYNDRCNQYPASLALGNGQGCPTGVTLATFLSQTLTPPSGAGTSAWDTSYYYMRYNSGSNVYTNYVLHTTLESTNAAVVKGLTAATIQGMGTAANWSQTPTSQPWSSCSNVSTSLHYCIGPN